MIVSITGTSGSGKTFVRDSLPESIFGNVLSTTTRPVRSGELPGHDYEFVTPEQFNSLKQSGDLFESTTFAGYQYGLRLSEIERIQSMGRVPVHVCTPSGSEAIQSYCASKGLSTVSVFLKMPLEQTLFRLLRRWHDDRRLDPSYLAKRIFLHLNEEQEWEGMFHFAVYSGTDRFKFLIAQLTDIASGAAAQPLPQFVASEPSEIKQLVSPALFTEKTVQDFILSYNRPRSLDECEQMAKALFSTFVQLNDIKVSA